MDYEKLHKHTLDRLQQMVSCGKITEEIARGICADFIPESEDEKVRKFIIKIFKDSQRNGISEAIMSEQYDKIFAWLEMQGEQKPAVIIPQFRVGDVIRVKGSNAEYRITEISDGYYRGQGWCLDIIEGDKSGDYELVEQNPAWSKEDDMMLNSFLHKVEVCDLLTNKENVWIIKKLKSLRPQSQWKPAEEQIRWLKWAVDRLPDTEKTNLAEYELGKLLEQLRKLREE